MIDLVGAKRRDEVSERIVYDTSEVRVKGVYKRRERTEERGKNVKNTNQSTFVDAINTFWYFCVSKVLSIKER